MTPEEHLAKLGLTAADIERLTDEAYREIVLRIREGEAPRAAIAAVQATWAPAYVEVLAGAIGERLGRAVGSADVRQMPVADVTLSRRLYAEQRQVSAAVTDIVKRHTAGFTQARELALELFEGYGFKDQEVLRLNPLNPQLPKYLRELIKDAGIRGSLSSIYARAQASALVTKPLRAAYLQLIDALEAGAGRARLDRLLRTAYYERMRYFANRIAQTELHRAYTHQQAKDLMADEEVEWVQWRLSASHPRPDICDLHAHVDRYGLGPGVYPKPVAPVPPAHPHCRCVLSPRLDLTERQGTLREGAETAWLRQSDHAQRIVGSRAKWERVKKGADPMTVAYENAEPAYRPKSVAVTAEEPILPPRTESP